jgi:hypothetical protein
MSAFPRTPAIPPGPRYRQEGYEQDLECRDIAEVGQFISWRLNPRFVACTHREMYRQTLMPQSKALTSGDMKAKLARIILAAACSGKRDKDRL